MATAKPDLNPLDTYAPDLFSGRTAVVTGGGTGLGRRTARAFADLGATVVVAGRDLVPLESLAAQLPGRVVPVQADIREISSVERLRDRAYEALGTVDFLVNNAGGQFPAPPSRISDNGWRAVVDLNLNGTWNVLSRFGPGMARAGFGAVVNVVHIYALDRGAPYFAHSGAARAGVVNLTRTLAPYLGSHGVTINALAPGTIATRGFVVNEAQPLGLAGPDGSDARPIAGRLGTREEIAAAILFLCSPAARFVTGTVVVADGGEQLASWPSFWEEGILE